MTAVYPSIVNDALHGIVDGETINAQLVGGYVRDAAHTVIGDVTGTIGAPVTAAVTDITDGYLALDDITFPAVGGTTHITGVVFYRVSDGKLLCYHSDRADTIPLDITPNGAAITFAFERVMRL